LLFLKFILFDLVLVRSGSYLFATLPRLGNRCWEIAPNYQPIDVHRYGIKKLKTTSTAQLRAKMSQIQPSRRLPLWRSLVSLIKDLFLAVVAAEATARGRLICGSGRSTIPIEVSSNKLISLINTSL
jgi:hypothetical protein